jgi:hypothetical protein
VAPILLDRPDSDGGEMTCLCVLVLIGCGIAGLVCLFSGAIGPGIAFLLVAWLAYRAVDYC